MAFGFRNPAWVAFAIVVLLVMAVGCTSKDSPFGDRNRTTPFQAKGDASPSGQDCATERKKLCANLKPGAGGRNECLSKKIEQLSPKCKEFITVWSTRKRYRDFRRQQQELWVKACDSDFKKVCGGKASRGCVADNLKKVSKTCRKHAEAELNPCLLDRIRLCNGTDASTGPCMKKNQGKLSKACLSFRTKRNQLVKKVKQVCSPSLPDDCKGGKMMQCLRKKLNQFPGPCQVAFMTEQLEAS